MVQLGASRQILQDGTNGRSFETYESLHKFVNRNGTKRVREYKNSCKQLSTGSAIEVSVKAAQTIDTAGSTGLTIVGAFSADNAIYRNYTDIATLIYKSNTGTLKTATLSTGANATTEVAFKIAGVAVTDFYIAISLVLAINTAAGETFGMGTTGVLTYAVVQAEADESVAADLHGVGDVYLWDSANTAGDRGLIFTLIYATPWGEEKTALATLASTATNAIRFAISGVYVGDYFRTKALYTTTVVGTYCAIGVVGKGTIYGVVEAAYWGSVHTRFMALASTYESYLGKVIVSFPILDGALTIAITYTPYGSTQSITESRDVMGLVPSTIEINERLQPLTDVSMTIVDAATAGNANIECYCLDYI